MKDLYTEKAVCLEQSESVKQPYSFGLVFDGCFSVETYYERSDTRFLWETESGSVAKCLLRQYLLVFLFLGKVYVTNIEQIPLVRVAINFFVFVFKRYAWLVY